MESQAGTEGHSTGTHWEVLFYFLRRRQDREKSGQATATVLVRNDGGLDQAVTEVVGSGQTLDAWGGQR